MFRRAGCAVNRSKVCDVWADNGNHLARGAPDLLGLKASLRVAANVAAEAVTHKTFCLLNLEPAATSSSGTLNLG
jgi:hypothetical protein